MPEQERESVAPAKRPRVLVTGFSVFPGASVNPTEWLIGALADRRVDLEPLAELRTEVLPVDFGALPLRLEALGRDFAPDIAIHFGLSAAARGFTLERQAHNAACTDRPDVTGNFHPVGHFHEGGGSLDATLPLAAIHARLTAMHLPVAYSDSAGDYLCNALFYLACSPAFPAYSPGMAGFIHVPTMRQDGIAEEGLGERELLDGAVAIVETCCAAWNDRT